MSEELDYDEIVYVDDEGLGFTRRDFPAFDFPVGTTVAMAAFRQVKGTVVEPHEATGHAGPEGALEYVPVRWERTTDDALWVHVDGLVRV